MGTLPALIPFQMPQNQFNLGDTYVQMAKIKALQQQARLDELKIGAQEREASQDALWKSVMAGVYTPEGDSGLAAPAPPQAPPPPPGGLAAAQAGPVPQSPTAMLAQAGVQVPPVDTSQPALMNPSMVQAPQGAPPPSLATAQAPAPAQAAPPPGGLAQGGKTRPAFQGLMQPMNERALVEAHKINPERTEKWFTGMMKMQGDRIEQTKKQNDMVYRVLKAVDASPNPAEYWPEAVASLKRQGIPVPAALETYNPAMLKFKLNEHRSADVELTEAKTAHEQQLARTSQALGLKYDEESKTEALRRGYIPREKEAEIAQKETQTAGMTQEQRFKVTAEEHEARMRPLKQDELTIKNQIERVNADMARPKAQRDAEIAELDKRLKTNQVQQAELGVPQYLKDDADTNTALNQVMKRKIEAGEYKPGQAPGTKDIEEARRAVIQGKIDVAAANQRDAGKSAALKGVLENAVAKGQGAEDVHNVLDDMQDLIRRGTLTSTPSDAWRVYAQKLGLRPDDEASARTQVLQSLGERLTLAMAGGKLGGQVSDADRDLIARASGNFGKLMSPAQQTEALRQLRRIADRDLDQGNRILKQHKETGSVPEFGQVRKERRARTLDQATYTKKWEERKAQGWTKEGFDRWLSENNYHVDLD